MASRGANKKASRQAWANNRGVFENDLTASDQELITIIGGGRIGSLLNKATSPTLLLGRGDSIPEEGHGPIIIATRNDALEPIIESCPESRRQDLVFIQNGYLDDFLKSKGLLDNTQVLLYVAVSAKDADPIDGVTSENPDGLTSVTGQYAKAFASLLHQLDLKCRVLTPEQYRPAMFEKLIWISTYMLVGVARNCATVGEAGSSQKELVEKVINELLAAVSAKEGITFPAGAVERLAAYTEVVSNFPTGVKEFEWRNSYFYKLGDAVCPTHNGLLRECADAGKLGFNLP